MLIREKLVHCSPFLGSAAHGGLRQDPFRVSSSSPEARNYGGEAHAEPGSFGITPWADRVQLVDAEYVGPWELPAIGAITAPAAVLIRPDGYVAWVGDSTQQGLAHVMGTWFGISAAA